MKLQNIMKTSTVCERDDLFFHIDEAAGRELYDGYFNLVYIEKLKRYTAIEALTLNVILRGYTKISLFHNRSQIETRELEPDSRKHYRFRLPYDSCSDGVFWFALTPSGQDKQTEHVPEKQAEHVVEKQAERILEKQETQVPENHTDQVPEKQTERFLEGWYEAQIREQRSVNISVGICTYKREASLLQNLSRLSKLAGWIAADAVLQEHATPVGDMALAVAAVTALPGDISVPGGDMANTPAEEVYDHLFVNVIDNGQTLSGSREIVALAENSGHRVHLIPNSNTGGTGGFTRAMREALSRAEQDRLTHLLLMDDDALFFDDLFVRLFGFLSCLKDDFATLTVGGTLFREDYPYLLNSCGEFFGNMQISAPDHLTDLRDFDACIKDTLCSTAAEKRLYSAWWCCCYSMDVIRDHPLPLPLFIHYDDVQYSLNARHHGTVFLNGICVWHKGFELAFRGLNNYYDTRNTLITAAAFDQAVAPATITSWLKQNYIRSMFTYFYADISLIARGVEDFLKGVAWLQSIDVERHHTALASAYAHLFRLRPLREVESRLPRTRETDRLLHAEMPYTLADLQGAAEVADAPGLFVKKITGNGLLLPSKKETPVFMPFHSIFALYRHKTAIAYEPGTGKAAVIRRDPVKMLRALLSYFRIVRLLKKQYAEAAQGYRDYYRGKQDVRPDKGK